MQTYQTTKDSGIAWLGDIPADWQQKRAKFLFYKSQQKPLKDDDVVTAFRDGEVVLRSQRRTDGFTFADKEIGYQHVDRGDLVIHAMDAFAGAIGVSKSNGKMSPVCSICKPLSRDVDTTYYAYLLRAMTKTNWLVAIAKGIRERSTDFRYGDFGNMLLPLPPLQTQKAIVAYIDEETALIDDLIAKQQHLLALLEEKRNAAISSAVTRSLKSHPMRDTDLQYLSRVPDDWQLLRASMLFKENKNNNAELVATNPVQFKFGEIASKNIDVTDEILEEIRRYTVVDKGDIMLNGLNLNYDFVTQRVAIVKEAGCITPAYISLRPRKIIEPMYACYLLKSLDSQKVFNGWGTGIRLTLNFTEFRKYYLPLPPLDEQQEIVAHINEQQQKADELKAKVLKQIDLLKERRTSLISSAVTGKVKV